MISAVILTKNEEKNIVDCIETLNFCSEVLVVDDNSTDLTVELSRKHGAKVLIRELQGDFSGQRNFALDKTANEWVLFVDADERVSKNLASEISKTIKENSVNGYMIHRIDKMFGKELTHGELKTINLLRLGRKGKGRWVGKVHEVWEIEGRKNLLKNSLLHIPHQTIFEFLSKINLYTTLRAKELKEKGVSSSLLSIIFYTKLKFIQTYFIKLGFLDGIPGLIVSLMMSLHSFLTRAKLWMLYQHEKS